MADLSFLNELRQGSLDAVDLWYQAQEVPRGYLGLSACGNKCKRLLWYTHKGIIGKRFEGRLLRLFQLGNLLEDQVVADLRAVGFNIYHSQREVVFTQGDVTLKGHIDGIITGLLESPETPHLFECKSAALKKFEELLKKGSYREWNKTYYWQVQFYMLGLKLKRAAVFVYCKNDSRMYLERIKLDRQATIDKLNSIFEAITSPIEPARACPRRDYFEAKWCDYYEECFGVRKAANLPKVRKPWKRNKKSN
jgi:hypothetical protein